MIDEQPVSFRKFAIMVGQSEGAVRKAIMRNSIKNGVVIKNGAKKVIPTIAAFEWGKEFASTAEALVTDESLKDNTDLAGAAKSVVSIKTHDTTENDNAQTDGLDYDESAEDDELRKGLPPGMSKAEADKMLSILKVKRARIELAELEGRLIDKRVVQQNLSEMGLMIRDTFMNMPARLIDAIMSADSRNEKLIVFENGIAAALTSLSALDNAKIDKR